ncbi:MAG TPA: SCP-2 sterol transfer family protein [Thioalkalivibrio sp.]|nr:SCP-2 sterol transfer family protein [Thioalkalivibrio sp.]
MSDLFTATWMEKFQNEWNGEKELAEALGKIGFNSVIGYGYPEDEAPRGVIHVENGKVVKAGAYDGEDLNWDLRASPDQWQHWMQKGPGMTGLGLAFTTGKLKFKKGDYSAMVKDPRMAGPFVKSFDVMSRI